VFAYLAQDATDDVTRHLSRIVRFLEGHVQCSYHTGCVRADLRMG
jgi:hypothetical protein